MSDQATLQPGDVLANPVTGERFTLIQSAASSGGALLAFELDLRAGGRVPMPHVHPIQTERFHVLDGTFRFRVGRRSFLAASGEVVEIAPGVIHGFANPGPGPARMRVEVSPALEMEQMLAEVVALAEAGRDGPGAACRATRSTSLASPAPTTTLPTPRFCRPACSGCCSRR